MSVITRKKAIAISLDGTGLSVVVQVRADAPDHKQVFYSKDLNQAAKYLINERLDQISKQKGRDVLADEASLQDSFDNLSYHFMVFCADSGCIEQIVFEGFNDQHGRAIRLQLRLSRTEIMQFNSSADKPGVNNSLF